MSKDAQKQLHSIDKTNDQCKYSQVLDLHHNIVKLFIITL